MQDLYSARCNKQRMISALPITLEALFIMDAMQMRPDSSWSATCTTDIYV